MPPGEPMQVQVCRSSREYSEGGPLAYGSGPGARGAGALAGAPRLESAAEFTSAARHDGPRTASRYALHSPACVSTTKAACSPRSTKSSALASSGARRSRSASAALTRSGATRRKKAGPASPGARSAE